MCAAAHVAQRIHLPSSPLTAGPSETQPLAVHGHAAAIIESAYDAIVCCSPERVVTVVNASAERLYGRSRGELLGRPVTTLIAPDRVAPDLGVIDRALGGQRLPAYETAHVHADGSAIEVSVGVAPILDGDRCIGVSLLARDIGSRLAAARELARTRKLLEEHAAELGRSNADLEQFAYVASHDLSEPLRTITGMLALLKDECGEDLGPDADDYIARAVAGAERMRRLIEDLLSYSRIGRRTPSVNPVDLGAVVEDAVASLDAVDAVEVTTPLPVVEADQVELRQVFQNLISNGLKFNESDRPRVEISARRDKGIWSITVADNGIGIPPEYAERIFRVFKRLHTRDAYAGTGIGLAIVERIVERRGGQIHVEDGDEPGARITFTVPDLELAEGPQ